MWTRGRGLVTAASVVGVIGVAAVAVAFSPGSADDRTLTTDPLPSGHYRLLAIDPPVGTSVGEGSSLAPVAVPAVLLVNDPDAGPMAFVATSTHPSRCPVDPLTDVHEPGIVGPRSGVLGLDAETFGDQCDGSSFDGRGCVLSGPAPRGLDRVHLTVDDTRWHIDLTRVAAGTPGRCNP